MHLEANHLGLDSVPCIISHHPPHSESLEGLAHNTVFFIGHLELSNDSALGHMFSKSMMKPCLLSHSHKHPFGRALSCPSMKANLSCYLSNGPVGVL